MDLILECRHEDGSCSHVHASQLLCVEHAVFDGCVWSFYVAALDGSGQRQSFPFYGRKTDGTEEDKEAARADAERVRQGIMNTFWPDRVTFTVPAF
jgi:hypothetical protein